MKKVGILYIVTGEYWKFWDKFYKSCEKYFLAECELHYYLFTDNTELLELHQEHVHLFYHEQQEWPYPTLLRYQTFYDHQDIFNDMDYLIFCNANLLFLKPISFAEVFFDKSMFATLHPGYFDKSPNNLPYEVNKKSLAYVEKNSISQYVCGGFNGGSREGFLRMTEQLMQNIEIDLSTNIIAKWHDESHFNQFVNQNSELFNILDSGFCYPENRRLHIEKKVLVRDKDRVISIRHKGLFYTFRYLTIKQFRNFKNLILDILR